MDMIDFSRKGLRKYKKRSYKIILIDSEGYTKYTIFQRYLFFFFVNIGIYAPKDKNISELEESYKRIIDAEELLKSINKELRKERKYNNIVYRFNLYTYYSSFIAIQIKNLFWWKNVTSPILKHDNIHHIDDAVNAKFNPSYKDSIITQINEGIKILERNYKNMIDFYFYNRNTSVRKTNINNKEYIIESHFYLRDNNVKYFVKERFLFFFWRYFRMNRGIYYTNKSYQIEDAYKLYLLENKKYNSKTIITEKEQKAINIIM